MSIPEASVDSRAEAPLLFVAIVGDESREHAFALARRLRGAGISTVVDLEGRKLKKSLAVANNLGVRFSLIIGENEIRDQQYLLRNMASGEQVSLGETELIETLKKHGGQS
jgi:histidyl-tRNA synthetase